MTKKNSWFGMSKLFISMFLLVSFFVPACIVKAVQHNGFAGNAKLKTNILDKTEKKQVSYKMLENNKGSVISINNNFNS